MSTESPRQIAKEFAEKNLVELCANVIYWRKEGRLPDECVFNRLAELCAAYAADDEFQEAERLVIPLALEKVANS